MKGNQRAKGRGGEGETNAERPASLPPLPHSLTPPLVPRRVNVTGIEVDDLNEEEAVAAIARMVEAGRAHYLCVVNAAKAVAASRDQRLRDVLAHASLVTADGMSVVWAARWLGQSLKARVTGIDLFERLVAEAARRGWSVYFLGASVESVGGVTERFSREHPALRVAGWRDGYFDKAQSVAVADEIRRSRADLLFVAMGSPAQEFWIADNLERTGARFAMGVGGSFDHLSGRKPRAPRWMQRAGFEWLYRLLKEPRRLWRRYLVGNTQFLRLVLRQRRAPR